MIRTFMPSLSVNVTMQGDISVYPKRVTFHSERRRSRKVFPYFMVFAGEQKQEREQRCLEEGYYMLRGGDFFVWLEKPRLLEGHSIDYEKKE